MKKNTLISIGLMCALNFQIAICAAEPEKTTEEKDNLLSSASEYNEKGKYKKAIEIYKKIITDSPKNQSVRIDYIKTLLWDGNYDEAKKELAIYKSQFGEDFSYWTEEARYFAFKGQPQEALNLIAKIEKKYSKNPDLEKIKQYAENHATPSTPLKDSAPATVSMENQEQDAYEKLKTETSKAIHEKFYSKAIELYKQYLLKYPNSKEAMANLIKINQWAGNSSEALQQLNLYKQKFGEDLTYWTEEARYLALMGKPQEALNLIANIEKKHPKNPDLENIKQYAKNHITQDQKKSDIIPNLPTPNTEISKVQTDASQAIASKLYSKAIQIYENYSLKHPNNKEVNINLIKIHLWAGDITTAKTLINRYKQKFGKDLAYQTEYARYLAFDKKFAEAIQYINHIKTKEPNKDLLEIKSYAELQQRQKKTPSSKTQPQRKTGLTKKKDLKTLYQEAKHTEGAAQTKKTDAALYFSASQQYSMANKPTDALRMVQQALVLCPTNILYLKAQAEIANWLKYSTLLYESYHKILLLDPNNTDATLGLARYYGQKSYYYLSIKYYKKYLKLNPQAPIAWLEYAYIQTWCSNYIAALNILNQYVKRFGITFDLLKAKARVFAAARRPTMAFKINTPLLESHPKDLHLLNTQALAYLYDRQPDKMFKTLAEINKLQKPDETLNSLNRFLTTPYRSNIAGNIYHSEDTDTVRINKLPFSEEFFLTHNTRFVLDGRIEHIQANLDSGLNPIQGGMGLDLRNLMVGVRHRINKKLEIEGKAGATQPAIGSDTSAYYMAARLNPSDILAFTLSQSRDYYDVSARAVSLGIVRNFTQLNLAFTPILQQGFYLNGAYGSYSDSNQEKQWIAAYKFGILRTEKVAVDLGVFALWDKFSKRLDNGYYSPLNYYYHAGTLDASITFSQDTAYVFSFGLGMQKDETFLRAKPASDAAFKALFGITRNAMLTVGAGVSTRGRSIGTASATKSHYKVSLVDIGLVVRF